MAKFGFTAATEKQRFSIETTNKRSQTGLNSSGLSGEDARNFYENVLKDEHLSRNRLKMRNDGRRDKNKPRKAEQRVGPRRRVRGQPEAPGQRSANPATDRSRELMGLRFLHCAHEGNISGLRDLLSKGVNINFQVWSSPFSPAPAFSAYNDSITEAVASRTLSSGQQ